MIVKLLTKRHLEFLSLKGGCTGSSESTLVKMSNCWKSHALAHIYFVIACAGYPIWIMTTSEIPPLQLYGSVPCHCPPSHDSKNVKAFACIWLLYSYATRLWQPPNAGAGDAILHHT